MSKKAYLFLFTNWHLEGNPGHGKQVGEWPPFAPADPTSIALLTQIVNQRIEHMLPSDFPPEARIYLEHSSCGIELIGQEDEPNWENTWGTILHHPVCINSKENAEKLGKMLAGLTQQPRGPARTGRPPAAVFMIPQSPSSTPAPLSKYSFFIREWIVPNSKELATVIAGQLVDLAQTVLYSTMLPNLPPQSFPILDKRY